MLMTLEELRGGSYRGSGEEDTCLFTPESMIRSRREH